MTMRNTTPPAKVSPAVVNPIVTFHNEISKLSSSFLASLGMLPDDFGMASPVIDIAENENDYSVTAELPGMEAGDIKVTSSGSYVSIKGEKRRERQDTRAGFICRERSYGHFQRVIALPENADCDRASATFKNGLLVLTIPKDGGKSAKEHAIKVN